MMDDYLLDSMSRMGGIMGIEFLPDSNKGQRRSKKFDPNRYKRDKTIRKR